MKNNYPAHSSKAITLFICGIVLSCTLIAQANLGWIQRAGFPGPARHRSTAISVGNRGYMGLGHVNSVFDILFDDWFEYDPGTDTWMQKANFPGGPRYHAAAFEINNLIYVGTGRDISGGLHTDFSRYDPVTNTWTSIPPFPGAGRRGAVAFAINGIGYVGTGSYYSNFWKYDPTTNSWTQILNLPGSGRISAVACAINGKGYLSTGDNGGPSGDMWEYDPTLNTWTPKATLPGLPRMEACGFALNNKFYVGTGDNFSSGTNYQDFWCYDPANNSWIQVTDFYGQARRYMSSFVIANRAYAGLGTSGINYADLWEFGSISGVEENEFENLSMQIFPNPISDQATINFSSAVRNADLILTDLNGKEVRRFTNINGEQYSFERNDLADGLYFISLIESSQRKSISKIILN